MRRPPPTPPAQKARIYAVRDMMGALVSAAKRARKRADKAAERYGPMSEEYFAAKAGSDEAERNLKGIYITLEARLHTLEAPFKRRIEY